MQRQIPEEKKAKIIPYCRLRNYFRELKVTCLWPQTVELKLHLYSLDVQDSPQALWCFNAREACSLVTRPWIPKDIRKLVHLIW